MMHSDDAGNSSRRSPAQEETLVGATPGEFQGEEEAFFTHPEDLIGKFIGNVKLLEIVGRGGYGVVYRGHHSGLGRDVAVKFLHRIFDEKSLHRFKTEAKNTAALDKHPAIVTVHDDGVYKGLPYFVLEYVDSNAKTLLHESAGALEPHVALGIVSQIASALESAHENGLIHRDVKPGNILIEKEGQAAKLADFGLARLDAVDATDSTQGVIRGTAHYISPEQIRGEELDGRTDIYSLGVTLYEFLSGALPYEGDSSEEVIENIRQNRRIPLQRRPKDFPSAILDVVDKATAYDRKDRYSSAKDLKSDIDAILASMGAAPESKKADLSTRRFTSGQKVGLLAIGSIAVAALVAIALMFAFGQSAYGNKLVMADQFLENGQIAESEAAYRDVLAKIPSLPDAQYGLAYSLLLQGQLDDAVGIFAELADEPLRDEGALAVAWAEDQDDALSMAEMHSSESTAYFQTVAARLELMRQNHDAVVQRLTNLEQAQFHFKWQYAESLGLLGRALKAAQRPDDAIAAFDRMASLNGDAVKVRANDYIESVAIEQAKTERAQRLRTRLQVIRQRMDEKGYTPPSASEQWRSRPIRFTFVAARNDSSAIAAEYGLAERIPVWMERRLGENTALTPLSRENLDDVLLEQEIALELASSDGAIQLGQMLAGRISIEPRMSRFGSDEHLEFRIVDNETSSSFLTPEIPLERPLDQAVLTEAIEEVLIALVSERYPIRGTLYKDRDGFWLDVGSAVGIRPGDSFVLLAQANLRADFVLPGIKVVVRGSVEAQRADVEILSANDAPVTGLEKGVAVVAESWYLRATDEK